MITWPTLTDHQKIALVRLYPHQDGVNVYEWADSREYNPAVRKLIREGLAAWAANRRGVVLITPAALSMMHAYWMDVLYVARIDRLNIINRAPNGPISYSDPDPGDRSFHITQKG